MQSKLNRRGFERPRSCKLQKWSTYFCSRLFSFVLTMLMVSIMLLFAFIFLQVKAMELLGSITMEM